MPGPEFKCRVDMKQLEVAQKVVHRVHTSMLRRLVQRERSEKRLVQEEEEGGSWEGRLGDRILSRAVQHSTFPFP